MKISKTFFKSFLVLFTILSILLVSSSVSAQVESCEDISYEIRRPLCYDRDSQNLKFILENTGFIEINFYYDIYHSQKEKPILKYDADGIEAYGIKVMEFNLAEYQYEGLDPKFIIYPLEEIEKIDIFPVSPDNGVFGQDIRGSSCYDKRIIFDQILDCEDNSIIKLLDSNLKETENTKNSYETSFQDNPNAVVTILQYGSFQDPFSIRFFQETFPKIKTNFIYTGKVNFEFKHFPLSFHTEADEAAEASECAKEQGKFWEMHDMLFEKGVSGGVSAFKSYAQQLGLDTTKFNSCLDSRKYRNKIQNDLNEGKSKGVEGTPTFFINEEKIVGAQPYYGFEETINKFLEQDSASKKIEESKESATKPSGVSEKKQELFGGKTNWRLILIIIGIFILVLGLFYFRGKIKNIFKPTEKPIKKEREVVKEKLEQIKKPFNENIEEAIKLRGFTVKHGKSQILNNINLTVKRGQLVSIVGSSGSGKSTIIESLVGRKKPTRGEISILGEKMEKVKDFIGFVPQHPEVYMNQTVYQNMANSATKYGINNPDKIISLILDEVQLSHRKNLKANNLSGGQLKLLSLGMELIRNPEVLILDEPTTGLDPNTRNHIITIISSLVSHSNRTVIFTTHFMDDAEECDEVIIVGEGSILAQGPPTKLEKRLPGGGKIVNVILDQIDDKLLKQIEKIKDVKALIREGRSLNIITDNPNPIKLGNEISELDGIVNETKGIKAGMKDVFVFYTKENTKE